ncbi:MAG: FtsX-like permease family protein [Cyclobacteriaceae bacterium]
MRHSDIPKLSYRLFKWFCHEDFFEELQGDLEENFLINVDRKGKKKARKIYHHEVIKLLRPSAMKKTHILPKGIAQLSRNYLKTSFRAVKHNPGYIMSNIIGLAIALSISTIGYFYYNFNDTFNKHYDQAAHLYKVHGLRASEATLGSSSIALAPSLKAAGIEAMRYHHETIAVRLGTRLFQESTVFADPEYLESFELRSLSGQKLRLQNADEIFISEKMAGKLFGDFYPVGELVEIVFPNEEERSFVVKDVFQDPPQNVSFHFPMITSFDNYIEFYGADENDLTHYIDGTFVNLENIGSAQVDAQLNTLIEPHNKYNPERVIEKFRLDNILEWPNFETTLAGSSFWNTLHPASVWGTVSTAFAILLLACFNFINTSIALSGKRLKEIAVRKVMGGSRKSTIAQFMIENSLMVFASVVLSVGISYYLIPAYNSLMTQEIVQLNEVPLITLIYFSIGLILFVALLSGAYPSFYISRFSSLEIFRDKLVISGKNKLMIVLLTFQFSLCFYNFSSLFVNVDNSIYQETLDRGYNLEKVINIPLYSSEQLSELRNRLDQHPDILQVAGTSNTIGFNFRDATTTIDGRDYEVADLAVGVNYPEIIGIRLIKGSFFSEQYESSAGHIIINKMLEDEVGQDLLNKSIKLDDQVFSVIGVVEDFNLRPMMFENRIKPTVLRPSPENSYRYATLESNSATTSLNSEIEGMWYELFPQQLYKGFLQEKVMENIRETNTIMVNINLFSSAITILISALGLYTLIALNVQRRSKEFGIRKVLGASKSVIIRLLGKDLYWILGIAMVVGLGGAYFVTNAVFDIIYAYHVSFGFSHLLWPTVSLVGIVIFTIGYKVLQTGKMNPVEQLRME